MNCARILFLECPNALVMGFLPPVPVRVNEAVKGHVCYVVARCVTVPRRASSNASRSFSLDRRDALLCLAELR